MSFSERIVRKLRHILHQLRQEPGYWELLASHWQQLIRFYQLRWSFTEQYSRVSGQEMRPFVTPLWADFNRSLERSLLPHPSWSFLRNPTIASTMVITKEGLNMQEELTYLTQQYVPGQLSHILREDPLGRPFIANQTYLTSHNSIHHAHHIARFFSVTGAQAHEIDRVVEWGGGYGNLVKIYRRITNRMPQWVIIDTPLLSVLQWLYLSTIFGPGQVKLITSPDQKPLEHGITLVPVQWYQQVPLRADLFVSTWAISESPIHLQDDVAKEYQWFGAQHLLIGYQEGNSSLPDAGHIGDLARESGAVIEDLPHLPAQHYAFK